MKCNIIRDILPLYVENLCSLESKEEVEQHLVECEECQREYEQLCQEYAVRMDNQNVENFLEDKDLLEKSKKEIKTTFADKIISRFFTVMIALGLLINTAMVGVAFLFYRYKYPRLYFKEAGLAQIWILILPFLPTFLALIGKITIVKLKKYRALSRMILVGMIPAVLMGAFGTVAFLVMPPISSTTYNPSHYMELDGDMEQFMNAISTFYPDSIPEDSRQIGYHYEKYPSFFADRIEIGATWILPTDQYTEAKKKALELTQFRNCTVSESEGKGSVLSTVYPGDITVTFEFNDQIMKVSYRAYANQNY